MRKSAIPLSLGVTLLVSGPVPAENHAFRQQDAHLHGAALLNIVLEDKRLLMEFESPAANIVGFEHALNNAEQEQAVSAAKAVLSDAAKVFVIAPSADCQPDSVEVEWSLEHGEDQHEEEHHDEDEQHAEDEHDRETHSEFHATYSFVCDAPAELGFIDVLLFKEFPATEEIEVQVIGSHGQSVQELTPASARIEF